MRKVAICGALALATLSASAGAETVIVYTDPMTLERKVVVTETGGPDRAYHCFLPPSSLGCQKISLRRAR
ncbi:hypothetical protein [Sphingomonas mesophila]|uniref:hypothetical protein n=1 Tax=Sphingomonas mesophila TaxID=2303576 RepID=UPI0013C2B197|nr:hypothetical protein [Sphingomonas mesophila]